MSSLFAILFLLALGLLIWGVMSPKSISKFGKKPMTRKDAGLVFGIIAVVFFVLTGITAPPQEASNTTAKTATNKISAVESDHGDQEVAPIVTTETVTETEVVLFEAQTVESSSLSKGTTKVTTQGVNGVKIRTIEITYEDDRETKRTVIKEEVTTRPVAQVTTIGTKVVAAAPKSAPKPTSNCDPNYSGGCVPIASDVDCAGGSGNGPAYVSGPVTVVGSDIYNLDADNDGLGCE